MDDVVSIEIKGHLSPDEEKIMVTMYFRKTGPETVLVFPRDADVALYHPAILSEKFNGLEKIDVYVKRAFDFDVQYHA